MKSGDAVFLHLAATLDEPAHDLTLIFYDCEEIAAEFNGLGAIERELPDWLSGDVAILGEPTAGLIGRLPGHSAGPVHRHRNARLGRAWMGDNAIHKLGGL
jgi:succinyl-diaminopimelate desuccinylase